MFMSNTSDTKRLAEAVANLATTITKIIELKLRETLDAAKAAGPVHGEINMLTPAEGWVGMEAVVAHLKISRRTMYSWMQRGLIPHVRIRRKAKFKLSLVYEAMNRRSRGADGY